MEKFKEIKSEILRRGYEADACDEIERAEESESMEELAQVIKDNFFWCAYNQVLDTEIIGKYKEEFASVGIYANESRSTGYVVIDSEVGELSGDAIAILYGNATVSRVYGNATVSRGVRQRHSQICVRQRHSQPCVRQRHSQRGVRQRLYIGI